MSDPNLDLVDSLSRIDRPLLVARTRLVAALQAAGINQKGATAKRAASSSLMAHAQKAKATRRSQQRYQLHAAASMLRQQQGKGIKEQKLTPQEWKDRISDAESNRQLKKARWFARIAFQMQNKRKDGKDQKGGHGLTLQEPAQPTSNRQPKKARWIAKIAFMMQTKRGDGRIRKEP